MGLHISGFMDFQSDYVFHTLQVLYESKPNENYLHCINTEAAVKAISVKLERTFITLVAWLQIWVETTNTINLA